jgi:hypothetical protein
MLSGAEIRARVREGLASGRLGRLRGDRARLRGADETAEACHVCAEAIPRGQVFELRVGERAVPLHLECYVFWLHASGLLEREPLTCAECRRLIPPHAETMTGPRGIYHARCRDRMEDREAAAVIVS